MEPSTPFGDAVWLGDIGKPLNKPVARHRRHQRRRWLLPRRWRRWRVLHGNARYFGSLEGKHIPSEIVSMAFEG
jgi:hypothetical protein